MIHIRRTLKYEEGEGYYEDTPKTKSSRRDIPLTQDVEKLLDAQKHYWGEKIVNISRYVFCTSDGKPLSRDRVQYEIDRIIKQINQSGKEFERITPHVFRHICNTCHRVGNEAADAQGDHGTQLTGNDNGFVQSCNAEHQGNRNGIDSGGILGQEKSCSFICLCTHSVPTMG